MTSDEGGFSSAQDADSEGIEGKFYVLTPEQFADALAPGDADLMARLYDVTAHGNFEGRNILHLQKTPEEFAAAEGIEADQLSAKIADARGKLYEVRSRRVWPGCSSG